MPVSGTLYYVNLTNGLEAFHRRWIQSTNIRFLRVQSTHCEQKRFYDMVQSMSDDLLFNLAIGRSCVIIDFGARKDVPRAIWQGMEFVAYCIHRLWADTEYIPVTERGKKCVPYFRQLLREMPDTTKHKLCYFRQFYAGTIRLSYRTAATAHDGDKDFFWGIVRELSEITNE